MSRKQNTVKAPTKIYALIDAYGTLVEAKRFKSTAELGRKVKGDRVVTYTMAEFGHAKR